MVPLYTDPVSGEQWKRGGHDCILSMASLCVGPPVITTVAEAKMVETKTG